jgi:hypothetical protein
MTQRDSQAVAIGQAVRGAIAQAGLSQADAAPRVNGMHLNSLSRRINGAMPFTYPELVAVSRLTGVTVAELVAAAERIAARSAGAAEVVSV